MDLVELVLARLDATGIQNTELHSLWGEVTAEISDPKMSHWRSLEARLGLDPDEGSDAALGKLIDLSLSAGADAADEIASACGGPLAEQNISRVQSLASKTGLFGSIDLPRYHGELARIPTDESLMPWDRGRELARSLRFMRQLGSGPITSECLSSMLGISEVDLFSGGTSAANPVLGLAKKTSDHGQIEFIFRKERRESRRFEAARFIGDFLVAPPTDHWLPLTGTKTGRQKLQRAFAAELLSPIDSLLGYLGNDFSKEKMEAAAGAFKVSSMVVQSQLANNGYIASF